MDKDKDQIQKWEYKIVHISNRPLPNIEILNDLGMYGWELSAIANDSQFKGYYIFKRPIKQQ